MIIKYHFLHFYLHNDNIIDTVGSTEKGSSGLMQTGYAPLLSYNRIIEKTFKIHSFTYEMVITKTCLYNFDPFKPHFYIVKLGFAGV